MGAALDLFTVAERYPHAPGSKRSGTSADAAASMAPSAAFLRERVLATYRAHRMGLTADEAAALLELSVLAIRPRVSELVRMGKLVETSERRLNESKRSASVWRAV